RCSRAAPSWTRSTSWTTCRESGSRLPRRRSRSDTSLLREHPERLRLPFQRRLRLLSGCLGAGLPRVEKLAVEELRLEGRQVELARRPIDQRRALGGGVLGEALQDPLEGALDVGLAEAHGTSG